mmetsp:Transcript_10954/g.17950  ORF Transcript_10954/g.17950 Transcript_10954/m.17950 type:complete len:101 (+) Transcript_10954:78-380(+)
MGDPWNAFCAVFIKDTMCLLTFMSILLCCAMRTTSPLMSLISVFLLLSRSCSMDSFVPGSILMNIGCSILKRQLGSCSRYGNSCTLPFVVLILMPAFLKT